MTATTTDDDPLRPTVCPRCEYSLGGLPARGTCPECGRTYGSAEVVLYGYLAGRQFEQRKGLNGRGLVIASSAVSLGAVIDMVITSRRAPFGIRFLPWHTIVPIIALLFYTRQALANRGSGLLQVRIGADGVRQGLRGLGVIPYDKADAVVLTPWSHVRRMTTNALPNDWLHVTVTAAEPGVRITQKVIDAVVRCPPATVDALQDRIAEWRAVSSRPV